MTKYVGISFCADDTVLDLKRKISQKLSVPVEKQRLKQKLGYKKVVLQNNSLLRDKQISQDSELFLLTEPRDLRIHMQNGKQIKLSVQNDEKVRDVRDRACREAKINPIGLFLNKHKKILDENMIMGEIGWNYGDRLTIQKKIIFVIIKTTKEEKSEWIYEDEKVIELKKKIQLFDVAVPQCQILRRKDARGQEIILNDELTLTQNNVKINEVLTLEYITIDLTIYFKEEKYKLKDVNSSITIRQLKQMVYDKSRFTGSIEEFEIIEGKSDPCQWKQFETKNYERLCDKQVKNGMILTIIDEKEDLIFKVKIQIEQEKIIDLITIV
ncbi:MAG: hypothetical protein EZS28_047946, partial [Streblomastix strix]